MSQPAPSPSAVSSGTRQNKRKKVSESAEEIKNATPSKGYWFEDGNVILHVENTLFRVHRGVLARHSAGFEDVFQFAEQDVFEGCDIAELEGNKVEDWDRVLGVIYDLNLAYRTKERSVEIVGSMLRLGKKYRFEAIYNDAFQRLRKAFPANLEEWTGPESVKGTFGDQSMSVLKLLPILLELGNQTSLPALFFWCAVYANGTGAIYEACRMFGILSAHPTMFLKLAIGREKILAACLELHFGWAFKPVEKHDCKRSQCQSVKQDYLRQFHLDPKPFIGLTPTAELLKDFQAKGMCGPCTQAIGQAHEFSRKVMWARLPSFFGLPAWKDLKDG